MAVAQVQPPDAASAAAAAAYAAGIRDAGTLRIAVAVAGAESAWNPSAEGDTGITDGTWGPSIGLWQIRSLKAQTGTGQTRDAARLKDPLFNAKSMVEVSGGGANWGAWSAYTNGAYRQNLGTAATAAAWAVENLADESRLRGVVAFLGSSFSDVGAAVATASGLGGLASAAGVLRLAADPKQWARLGLIAAGSLLAIFGVLQLVRDPAAKIAGAAL